MDCCKATEDPYKDDSMVARMDEGLCPLFRVWSRACLEPERMMMNESSLSPFSAASKSMPSPTSHGVDDLGRAFDFLELIGSQSHSYILAPLHVRQ